MQEAESTKVMKVFGEHWPFYIRESWKEEDRAQRLYSTAAAIAVTM